MSRFTSDPEVTFATYVWQRVHVGTWSVRGKTLVVGVNLDPQERKIPLTQLPGCEEHEKVDVLYSVDTRFESGHLIFEGLGAIGFVITESN